MWMFHNAAAPSASTFPGSACASAPSTGSGTRAPITWRTDTCAGRGAFRMFSGEEILKASKEAQVFGIPNAITHFGA